MNTGTAALTPHIDILVITGALLLTHGVPAPKYHLEFQEAVDRDKYFSETKTIDGTSAM